MGSIGAQPLRHGSPERCNKSGLKFKLPSAAAWFSLGTLRYAPTGVLCQGPQEGLEETCCDVGYRVACEFFKQEFSVAQKADFFLFNMRATRVGRRLLFVF